MLVSGFGYLLLGSLASRETLGSDTNHLTTHDAELFSGLGSLGHISLQPNHLTIHVPVVPAVIASLIDVVADSRAWYYNFRPQARCQTR